MKFLEEIVEVYLTKYADHGKQVSIVFPNRRAGLFFQKYLSEKIQNPIWSPKIQSIEEYIRDLSDFRPADRLELIYELYLVFRKLNKSKEEFERFYYWGNIMLQDFDELDKFMVDPELLFMNLVHVKNLEGELGYLDENQKKLISEFWKSFGEKISSHQKDFLSIWDNLLKIYHQFREALASKGVAYDGMIYRLIAEDLSSNMKGMVSDQTLFAGFNALSKSEELIISHLISEGKAEIFWDTDDHYLKNNRQEAGHFLREMKFGNQVLGNTFRSSYGNAFEDSAKNITVSNVASDVGQTQLASKILSSLQEPADENTCVVLPESELLFPLLHALPDTVERLNITMGYPLKSSTIFSFLNAAMELQIRALNKNAFHYRTVLSVLQHPVMTKFRDEQLVALEKEIYERNAIWIPKKRFAGTVELVNHIFQSDKTDLVLFLQKLIELLADKDENDIDREFLYRFFIVFNKLTDFIDKRELKFSPAAFQKLFVQMVQNERLPFEGEPLLGLQVMGILETRNLDFQNVIVLSTNEGTIPPPPKGATFIPYSLRKVFEMPVSEHQDAMYAYMFYRLIQRASNVHLIYNSTEDTGKSGEVTRFVRQLQYETNLPIEFKTISSSVSIEDPRKITIQKTESFQNVLHRFTSLSNFAQRLTPTALTSYLDCRLRFYFRYIQGLKEQDELAEEVDPMIFGNILHNVMEQLYSRHNVDGNRTVQKEDVKQIRKDVDKEIAKAFGKQFGSFDKEFQFEGQNLIAREIIRKMVMKVLDYDASRIPFNILGLEANEHNGFATSIPIEVDGKKFEVGLKGIIDRIEQKDGIVRIIDYKTGSDNRVFTEIVDLFDRDKKQRNKAVFQTIFYGFLYQRVFANLPDAPIQACLFNIRELFSDQFSPLIQKSSNRKKAEVSDVRVYLEEFMICLTNMLTEIFDDSIPFDQTEEKSKCRYCSYAGICNR